MGSILDIKTVHQCNSCLGCKTLHPQASVIRLGDSHSADVGQHSIRFDFYTVLLIDNGDSCQCRCCGQKPYDYTDATMVFLSPEKAFGIDRRQVLPRKGWLLAFHPDLLCGTTLSHTLHNYTFFNYDKAEALHLSLREKHNVEVAMKMIDEELHHPIDVHSRTIITRHIELLLDYCKRYYDRQFITREERNNALIRQFQQYIDDYIAQGQLRRGVFPTVQDCASHLHLSGQYFMDLLWFVTGKTLREYVELKRIETAKQMLHDYGTTAQQVSSVLGYPSVQHFALLFKKITGYTPTEYKTTQN